MKLKNEKISGCFSGILKNIFITISIFRTKTVIHCAPLSPPHQDQIIFCLRFFFFFFFFLIYKFRLRSSAPGVIFASGYTDEPKTHWGIEKKSVYFTLFFTFHQLKLAPGIAVDGKWIKCSKY